MICKSWICDKSWSLNDTTNMSSEWYWIYSVGASDLTCELGLDSGSAVSYSTVYSPRLTTIFKPLKKKESKWLTKQIKRRGWERNVSRRQ